MNTETALVPVAQSTVEVRGEDVHLTAERPEEMATCQHALIEWCGKKIMLMRAEATELKQAYEHARTRKWKTSTFERHWKLAEKRVVFYQKMLAALKAGYVIVPNFPVQMFAIRTGRNKPEKDTTTTTGYWLPDHKQDPQLLPEGEGEYQNPFPLVSKEQTDENHKKTWAYSWADFEFPLTMAKPRIMEATSRAMALKVFDDFGVLPKHKKEDPIIVGRLRDPRDAYGHKVVTFMVAWHLNTNVL